MNQYRIQPQGETLLPAAVFLIQGIDKKDSGNPIDLRKNVNDKCGVRRIPCR